MNIKLLKESNWLILDAIVGSNLYGLATKNSDIDHKGIFILPQIELGALNQVTQVSDEKQDNTYYELGRYIKLAMKANPNMLELLYLPENKILSKTNVYDKLVANRELFLTKKIKYSLGGYAIAQIHKAQGSNKKIVNPMPEERKTPLDFCYILTGIGATPIEVWLGYQRIGQHKQESYGLSKVDHTSNLYYIFHDKGKYTFKGIASDDSNELKLSSIPKEVSASYEVLYYNGKEYIRHCRLHREYWDWIKNRNESRYKSVEKHNKGYDGKNFLHCFRLLDMGIEAAKEGTLNVVRTNRHWLLDVREGKFEYDYLVKTAEDKLAEFDNAILTSELPDDTNFNKINDLVLELRNIQYKYIIKTYDKCKA